MRQYYLIPILESDVCFEGRSLHDITKDSYPIFTERENERISILYSSRWFEKIPESDMKKHQEHVAKTDLIYEEKQVPKFLIAVDDDNCVKEILTGSVLSFRNGASCKMYTHSMIDVKNYYYSSNYCYKIGNYFRGVNIVNRDPFNVFYADMYDVDGYISGEINGRAIEGYFNGKINIRKLIKK